MHFECKVASPISKEWNASQGFIQKITYIMIPDAL
jgi:hypothetical protein